MHVVNTYTISYQPQTPEKCLETSEQGKNNKYLHACLNKRHKFTPFITSVDGLIGVDAEATPKILASRLATKWKEPYSRTFRYVNSRVATTLARDTPHCIQRARFLTYQISATLTQWEYSAGIHLFW